MSIGKIGTSSIWEHKYCPKSVQDLVLPEKLKKYFQNIVESGEIPNMLFYSKPGHGKTATANALVNDLGASCMYINGSLETSIDTLRYKVTQFAMTASLDEGKKIVIMDETDRISANAADALKGILDQVESNCRFIFTTNNYSKIIDPILSRTNGGISFDFSTEDTKELMLGFFRRMCGVLDNEQIQYDKKTLATFVGQKYPDFRKTILSLQQISTMYGCIDERALVVNDTSSKIESLIQSMKEKKFNVVRSLCSELDYDTFFTLIYRELFDHIMDESKPEAILSIGEWQFKASMVNDKEIPVASLSTELMKTMKWK